MNHRCSSEEIVEIYNIEIEPCESDGFKDELENIHQYFSLLGGYKGIEILMLCETAFIILLRWEDCSSFEKNISMMLNSPIMKSWLGRGRLISHQPSLSKILFK